MTDNTTDPARGGATRRRFLTGAGLAAAGALATDWRSRTAFAAANARVIGANDRINIGVIGCGSMGTGHLHGLKGLADNNKANCTVVAVCDIYTPRKDKAKELTGGTLYHEYERLLEDKAVDAVLIATPEHWHSRMAIDAMEAGKDVYLEKPMARYVDEATEVLACAERTKRVLQVGNQASTNPLYRRAHDLLGEIGKPVWCQSGYCRNNPEGEWNTRIDDGASPDNVDWKRFLGPAPDRPFDLDRFFRWRKYWDYSAGICGDLLPHKVYPLLIVLGAELPTRVVAAGGNWVQKEDREVADLFHVLADFPSGYTMFLAGSTVNETTPAPMVYGFHANMLFQANHIEIQPQRPFAEEVEGTREDVNDASEDQDNHRLNWMDCIRSRETPNCGPWLGYCGFITTALAEISFRQNVTARFDADTKKLIT